MKQEHVVIGALVLTRIGGELARVQVVREVQSINGRRAFIVQTTPGIRSRHRSRELPKPRAAAALHPTRQHSSTGSFAYDLSLVIPAEVKASPMIAKVRDLKPNHTNETSAGALELYWDDLSRTQLDDLLGWLKRFSQELGSNNWLAWTVNTVGE